MDGDGRAKEAYRRRSEVAEFPNAWLKERFGVRKFRVRGLRKARSELLWAMLAYNVRVWIRLAWPPARGLHKLNSGGCDRRRGRRNIGPPALVSM